MSRNYPFIVKDKVYNRMYRVVWGKGDVSDMVNKTRAKDAIQRFEGSRPRIDARMARRFN